MRTPGPRTPAWRVLHELAARHAGSDIPLAFRQDPERERRFTRTAAGITLDFSRQMIDDAVLAAYVALLEAVDMRGAVRDMWTGKPINNTENRAAWHILLRRPENYADPYGGSEILEAAMSAVLAERQRMFDFVDRLHRQGKFRTIINIGIGGSDLGPAMSVRALRSWSERHHSPQSSPAIHFVSNVDGVALHDVLTDADPTTTLFIICSKTFTTQETRANAEVARRWISQQLGENFVADHFAAVSVNSAAMDEFGISPDRRFAMWDWVGGRYSVWSAVGLSLAIAIGSEGFREFLRGAHTMDEHFRQAPWPENLPALMALLGIWNSNFLNIPTLAVLPYSDRLARLPAFLQQLEMESNGKSVACDGSPVEWSTAPVIWGEPGNNAQHSFFQLLHQGNLRAALDLILIRRSPIGDDGSQTLANANAIAQIETFAMGRSAQDAHREHAGSRPQSVLLIDELTPRYLGALIALYEHKVYVQSVIWGINAFDQFGVEAGKYVCGSVLEAMSAVVDPGLDSVRELVARLRTS